MPIISAIVTAATTAFTAVSGAFAAGGLFASGTLLGTLGRAALSIGMSMGLSALSRKNTASTAKPVGVLNLNLSIGGDVPRMAPMGRIALKGHLAYAGVFDTSNARLAQVFILGDGRISDLHAVWIGDKRYELVEITSTHGAAKKFNFPHKPASHGEIHFFDGRDGQPHCDWLSTYLPADFSTSDIVAGLAYAIVHLWFEGDQWDNIPDILFEVDGYRCYDPRRDSTVGGTGTHRWDSPATWEFTRNPAIMAYNYIRGLRAAGQLVVGLGKEDYQVDTASFVAAANVCDEAVTLADGSTEPRYTAAEILTAGDADHRAALAPLMQACAGYLVERGGMIGMVAGAARLPVATITDADIDWTRGVRWAASRSRTERTNEVHGQFADPSAGFQANSYPAVTDASARTYDGERLAVQLDFSAVTSVTQAQRIAKIRMRETRKEASASLTVGYHLFWLEPGDWITWQSDRYDTTRTYMIVSIQRHGDDATTLELRETGADVFDWSSGEAGNYSPAPVPPASPTLPSTVENFAVQADVVSGRPVYRCEWTPITDERVVAVVIEYRVSGSTEATRVRDDSPGDGTYTIDLPLTGQEYEFRATIRTAPLRPVVWTAWESIPLVEHFVPPIDVANIVGDLEARILGDGAGSIAAAQAAANAAISASDDFRRAISTEPGVRSSAVDSHLTDLAETVELISRTVTSMRERFEEHRSQTIEAGLEINSVEGRARIYGIARLSEEMTTRFNEVSVTINALTAQINLVAGTVLGGDLSGLVQQIAEVGVQLDAVEASLTQYARLVDLAPLQTNVTLLSTRMDAAESTIATKATTAALTAQGARIDSAEQAISAINGVVLSSTAYDVAQDNFLRDVTLANLATAIPSMLSAQAARLANVSQVFDSQIAENGVAIATARLDLIALQANVSAQFSEVITAAAASNAALTSQISALNASVGALSATVNTNNTARVEGDAALAGQINTINATLNGVTAGATARFMATAGPSGGAGYISFGVSATGNGPPVEAGIRMYAVAMNNQVAGGVDLLGNLVRILHPNGTPVLSFDTEAQKMRISGDVIVDGALIDRSAFFEIIQIDMGSANYGEGGWPGNPVDSGTGQAYPYPLKPFSSPGGAYNNTATLFSRTITNTGTKAWIVTAYANAALDLWVQGGGTNGSPLPMSVSANVKLVVGGVESAPFAQSIQAAGPTNYVANAFSWSTSVVKAVPPGETITVSVVGYVGRGGNYAGSGTARLRDSASRVIIQVMKG